MGTYILAIAVGCLIGYATGPNRGRTIKPALTSFAILSLLTIIVYEII